MQMNSQLHPVPPDPICEPPVEEIIAMSAPDAPGTSQPPSTLPPQRPGH